MVFKVVPRQLVVFDKVEFGRFFVLSKIFVWFFFVFGKKKKGKKSCASLRQFFFFGISFENI